MKKAESTRLGDREDKGERSDEGDFWKSIPSDDEQRLRKRSAGEC